ncbi:MAG: class I SAM-dependent methyltransferase [Chloroflexota bacterium]
MSATITWNPASYAKNARFVSDLGEPLLELLAAKGGETILDLGCGDGALTEKIAAAGAKVFAVDSSLAQVMAARRRGVNALVMDGQALGFKRRFDAVFTNAVLHWLKRPEQVIEGVAASMKAGGRFVGEFGGKGNVDAIRAALHRELVKLGVDPWSVDPWYYPAADEYSALLQTHGFKVERSEIIPRPTILPGDLRGWLEVFAQSFTKALPEAKRENFVESVCKNLAPKLRRPDGAWYADYVRLRFKALRR